MKFHRENSKKFISCLLAFQLLAQGLLPAAPSLLHAADPLPDAGKVLHGPVFNGQARVIGSLQVLSPENVTLNGSSRVGELKIPGTPAVTLSGSSRVGETVNGSGSAQPTTHRVILNGQSVLDRLVRRTNTVSLAPVSPPPSPTGTRDVTITLPGGNPGNFATLRNLTVNGQGTLSVPAGTYGKFTVNGAVVLQWGVAGSSTPAVYNIQELTINGTGRAAPAGPVRVTVSQRVTINNSAQLGGQDPSSFALRISGTGLTLNGDAAATAFVDAPAATVVLNGRAKLKGRLNADRLTLNGDSRLEGAAAPAPVNLPPTVNAGPDLSITLPATTTPLDGTAADDGLPSNALTTTWSLISGPASVSFGNSHALDTTAVFTLPGTYVLALTAADSLLSAEDRVQVVVNPAPDVCPNCPPDPATTAPAVDGSVATNLASSTAFLYTGQDPLQVGVSSNTIHPVQVSVLRGLVSDGAGEPLPGATISILDHPELGTTLSRRDGRFDMAVNGGSSLVVSYKKSGFLPAQRPVDAGWQEYLEMPEVTLLALDSRVTAIDLSSTTVQAAQGTPTTDERGTRQATLLFSPGTSASAVLPDGSRLPLSGLHVRSTEYTAGPRGPSAMPGALPPASAYTYAVELSVDEAIAAGSDSVEFTQPVPLYVDNFLNFPVGWSVPVGYYDMKKGAWVPSDDGRVLGIVGVTGGAADLDVDGDGAADDASSLGVTQGERRRLAALYASGKTLWRASLAHFSRWDLNWPYRLADNARAPDNVPPPETEPHHAKSDKDCGSIIDCHNRLLGESIDLVGMPFQLRYQSDRVLGHAADRTVRILTGIGDAPPNLVAVELDINAAGRNTHLRRLPDDFTFIPVVHTWDGKDAYGRRVMGLQPAEVKIGYVWEWRYANGRSPFNRSFGTNSAAAAEELLASAGTETLSATRKAEFFQWDARAQGLGGWDLDVHHAYDPVGKTLLMGTGEKRQASNENRMITTAAGGGPGGPLAVYAFTGQQAKDVNLYSPADVAAAPDGSFYFTESGPSRLNRVTPEGTITTVGGSFPPGHSGDGGPATAAKLENPTSVALHPDGSIYFLDGNGVWIRKIDRDGIMRLVAGTGVGDTSPDGTPALAAQVRATSLAIDREGNVYYSEFDSHLVRRIGTDGLVRTVAGNGDSHLTGDNGPALAAGIGNPGEIALDGAGNLYIVVSNLGYNAQLKKVALDGKITTLVALTGLAGVAVARDGNVYLGVGGYQPIIRRLSGDGTLTAVAGTEAQAGIIAGDDGPALAYGFTGGGMNLSITPDGDLLAVDSQFNDGYRQALAHRIRKVTPSLPGFSGEELVLPSEDGTELYAFTPEGRHLRTVNALTGSVIYVFAYTPEGRLSSVTDADGDVTTIERGPSGDPRAIVGPFGRRTELKVDLDGYLSEVKDPAEGTTRMSYRPAPAGTEDGGLLSSFTNPRGKTSTFTYDGLGRLVRDTDATGGFKALTDAPVYAPGNVQIGHAVTVTTAEGRATRREVTVADGLQERRRDRYPDGTEETTAFQGNGTRITDRTDGTRTTVTEGADPRWKMASPVTISRNDTTPSGLSRVMTAARSVTLSDPLDKMSLVDQTDTATVNGRSYSSIYTAATKTFTDRTPAGRNSTSEVDGQGRLTRLNVPGLAPVAFEYDTRGRLKTATRGTGTDARATALAYNAEGFLASVTDPLNRTVSFLRDPAGRVTRQTLPDARIIDYAYDANGNVTSITPPGKPAHAFTYSLVDLTSSYAPPSLPLVQNVSTVYNYNLDRQPTLITRPTGETIGISYDPAGRVGTITTPTHQYLYGYDSAGRLGSLFTSPLVGEGGVGGAGETLSYAYDGSLPLSTTWSGTVAGTVARAYDANFWTTSQSVNGEPISFGYDNDGLLTQAGAMSLTRDAQNALLTGTSLGAVTDAWTFSAFAEPAAYTATANGSTAYAAAFTRDKLGRITDKTETVQGASHSYHYTYDIAERLTDVTKDGALTGHYAYGANSNRTVSGIGPAQVAATYDNQDRLLTYGGNSYTYNAAGDLKTKTDGSGVTSYAYDALGNLRSVNLPDGTAIEYVIDGQNRRVGKKINGALMQGFLYDGQLRIVAELNSAGNIISRFIYADRANVPSYMLKGGSTYRIVPDHLGSPRLVIHTIDGSTAQRLDYDEFGNVLVDTNPGFQPFGFAGGIFDRDTKLTRFGARDYDPETGRWMAKDPIDFDGEDTNLYGYVFNDPVNFVDLEGMMSMGAPWGSGPLGGLGGGGPQQLPVPSQRPQKDPCPPTDGSIPGAIFKKPGNSGDDGPYKEKTRDKVRKKLPKDRQMGGEDTDPFKGKRPTNMKEYERARRELEKAKRGAGIGGAGSLEDIR